MRMMLLHLHININTDDDAECNKWWLSLLLCSQIKHSCRTCNIVLTLILNRFLSLQSYKIACTFILKL